MSLIHWWPLNGDTKDYGCENITLTNNGATVDNSGKIGKCYSFNDTKYMVASNDLTSSNTEFSFAGWVYLVSVTNSNSAYVYSCRTSSGGPGLFISLERSLCVFDDGTRWQANYQMPLTTWVHFVFTRDLNGKKLYINGELKDSTTTIGNLSGIHNKMYVGKNFSADTPSSLNTDIKLNDFRIYNHVLSKKEIKELSKGLMLHYNFEEAVRPNLIRGNYQTYSTKDGKTESGSIIYNLPSDLNTLIGKTLVLSYDVKCVGDRKNNTGDYNKDRYCFHGAIRYKATESSSITTVYPFADNLEPRNVEKRVIMYCVIPSTWYSITNLTLANQSYNQPASTNNETWYIKNLKLEVLDSASDLPTPYSTESEENVVYDNSGYGNNGTMVGNLIISNDSISGRYSMKFNSDSYIDIIKKLPNFYNATYSYWLKLSNEDNNQYEAVFIPKGSPTASGIWLSFNTESGNLWAYQGANSPNYCKGTSTNFLVADTWYLCTHVFKNGIGQWYLNGTSIGNPTTYTSRNYITSNYYTIGDSHTGSSWSGTAFKGYISDFKIYATALSAEDIKAEYTRKASIDKQGNLYTGIFSQDTINIALPTKTGIIKANHYVEGGNKTSLQESYVELEYIESDGNQWIDTGVLSSYDLEIEADLAITEEKPTSSIRYRSLFGNISSWVMNFVEDQTGIRWVGQDINMYITTYTVNQKFNIKAGNTYCKINNVSINRSADTNNVSWGNFYIGRGYYSNIGKAKFYAFQIYNSGELIRDFIPAKRKSDNTIGLYDLVNKQFYTNQGTGTFTAGPELNKLNVIYTNELKEI